jgi:2-polyprenyl-6-methoxyphenol hydroxylase-like FAD-dependent oxidoreductase
MSQPTDAMIYHREVPVRHEVDVFVAGGGPAGLAAAWAAARQGAKVFLVEATGCLGGMGTAGGLPMFCFFTDGINFVSAGFGSAVYDRLWQDGAIAPGMRRDHPHGAVLFNGEILKRVYDRMAEEAGFGFSLFTGLVDVVAEQGAVAAAVCHGKSGLFAVRAKVFVDATGDGDLCVRAGATFAKGDADGEMQPGTLCSLWAGIDWARAKAAGHDWWGQSRHLPDAFGKGLFTVEDPHMPGLCQVAGSAGWGNIGHAFGVDGTDERSLTAAMVHARRILPEYERFFKEHLQGFERMDLVGTGAILGVRETRRIIGDYELGLDDFARRAVFADEIGRFAYPVDLHPTRPTAEKAAAFEEEFQSLRYQPGESYGIPYRSLLPQGLENVLVAGRCISCDRAIQGSIRVMPGCFITGQAAGTGAALAAAAAVAPRALPAPALRAALKGLGAHLP